MINEAGAGPVAALAAASDETKSRLPRFAGILLAALSSAKLTAVLIVAAMAIVMVGTVAQVYQDIWEVVDTYFRSWVCWVEWKVLFPPSFFPWAIKTDWNSLAIRSIPFPGGALIGVALAVNLVAAHATRFKIQARGWRLVVGLVVLAAGAAATWLVIAAGHNQHGVQGQPLVAWPTLWLLIKIGLVGLWIACLGGCVYVWRSVRGRRTLELVVLGTSVLGLGAVLIWLFLKGEGAALTASSLRILYQLIQGEIAALVLLFACILLFHRRAGIALLHGGVGLLMFGELFVSYFAVEQQITLMEGQTASFASDTRSVELAIRSLFHGDRSQVVAVPLATHGKATSYARGELADLAGLPFNMRVLRFYRNSAVRPVQANETNLADSGLGTQYAAEEVTPRSGVGGGQMDVASAYVEFLAKEDGKTIGTYLLSQHFAGRIMPESIAAGDKAYGLVLRFKQYNKPYQIKLLDVRKDDYAGTSMARNFASHVRLTDASRHVDFETKIWMNNPLRYAGETFYQSGYDRGRRGQEVSTLQVVKNTGWMIPYAACMIAATGMLAHFLYLLWQYLRRIQDSSQDGRRGDKKGAIKSGPKNAGIAAILVPVVAVALGVWWVASRALPPRSVGSQARLDAFAELPLMYEGRIKPFDTLARTSLRIISDRETFVDASGQVRPAIRWLLDVIARPEVAEKHCVFRVDSREVREMLGLERRRGYRYAWEELRRGTMEFEKQVALAQQQPAANRTLQQRKLLELEERIHVYRMLADSFRPLPLPAFPSRDQISKSPSEAAKMVSAVERLIKEIPSTNATVASMQPPLAAPVGTPEQPWLAYAVAKNSAYADEYFGRKKPATALVKLTTIFEAYKQGDSAGFNRAVADYRRLLLDERPSGYDASTTDLEAYFNYCAPFYNVIPLYGAALALAAFGWLAGAASPRFSRWMSSATFWLVVLAFAVHTLAMAARVVISGRPPVTNLYSSAVFVGWGCVLLGLCLELVFRLGVGNFVSSVAGIGTLIIAHFLAAGGDTIRVLAAVLDTQFWLSVHVLTVTMGYSATFLAGMLGLVCVAFLLGKAVVYGVDYWRSRRRGRRRLPSDWLSPSYGSEVERVLGVMIYGTVCFSVFFSFIGTVLGGLWADDSWGRFWGWDPKENGALIVVLWNALVLHAHGSRMVRERGLAVLAVIGNMVTGWSWFGVNELGVGLHSYGFTEGAARALIIFWISQIAVVGVGAYLAWFARRCSPAAATKAS